MVAKIQGSVLPAGTLQLGGAWKDGIYTVKLSEIQDAGTVFDEVKCEYEDGFSKFHQIKKGDIADLLGKISNQVIGRHGVKTKIKTAPKQIAEGAVIELEVANGR